MLRVAKKRIAKQKQKTSPKKPRPPSSWWHCDQAYTLSFFWDWLRADCDPRLTPDGKSWEDQDIEFWNRIWYLKDLLEWAEWRAKNPVMQFKATDETMESV